MSRVVVVAGRLVPLPQDRLPGPCGRDPKMGSVTRRFVSRGQGKAAGKHHILEEWWHCGVGVGGRLIVVVVMAAAKLRLPHELGPPSTGIFLVPQLLRVVLLVVVVVLVLVVVPDG